MDIGIVGERGCWIRANTERSVENSGFHLKTIKNHGSVFVCLFYYKD